MVSCFISKKDSSCTSVFGLVKADDGKFAEGYFRFEFDIETRKIILPENGSPKYDHRHIKTATDFFQNIFRTPETFMTMARIIGLSKPELAKLLNSEARNRFSEACARIERTLTLACTNNRETNCLASGCSVEGAEGICTDACLSAPNNAYVNSYTDAWLSLFRDPANRIDIWKEPTITAIL